jgi:Ca2+-binding RTX toxin-like protein
MRHNSTIDVNGTDVAGATFAATTEINFDNSAGTGSDTVIVDPSNGHAGFDTIPVVMMGGPGNDSLYGGKGHDRLRGDAGNDFINGDDGNDTLAGSDGNDRLYGGYGADCLFGRLGNDLLAGEPSSGTPSSRVRDVVIDYSGINSFVLRPGLKTMITKNTDSRLVLIMPTHFSWMTFP